ncbi:hypothetical protein BO70DRAFT_413775 [Aspergillus heteromorphus CBS 117.55]|uniref:Alcohol dehydrogenase-like C-terminal domain-containing protein n=1 Tax=Aspergillus heteromorphus CBS 117.55 TaxID=1448321 RepID=A0A317VII9_9EURO|nr:uncharacterized protein BO70DRAFT_413775 [Aspergillus heteromorphus CBS 117.55]PWY73051.1 hypothetical protein BO70DRAFT_413775 [Aspergillus heteromorphus CBS 117.55]
MSSDPVAMINFLPSQFCPFWSISFQADRSIAVFDLPFGLAPEVNGVFVVPRGKEVNLETDGPGRGCGCRAGVLRGGAVRAAGDLRRPSGATLVQAGMGKEVIQFPITAVCTRGLTIKGSIRYLTGCYPAAIDLIAKGKIDVKPLVTNRFPFEESEKAFELVKAGCQDVFKVMIAGFP